MKKIKNQLSANSTTDLKPSHVKEISKRLNVKEEEVVSMNRRLLGKEKSLNDPAFFPLISAPNDWAQSSIILILLFLQNSIMLLKSHT